MKKFNFLPWFLIGFLALSGCVKLSQRPAPTSTLPSSSPAVESEEGGDYPTIVPSNSVKRPVTWAHRNLRGNLVYGLGALDKNNNVIVQIHRLDLVTGTTSVLYSAIQDGWIYYASVSPNGKELALSYSPPIQSDPHVVQAIYMMPLEYSQEPQLLFAPPTREDQYTQVEWSPDGMYIYYTYVNYLKPGDPTRVYPLYKIFRVRYPVTEENQPQLVAEEAYWPRVSPDGSQLVYVSLDPVSGDQHLRIAKPDGSQAHEVVLSGSNIPHDKSSPFFSPDGKSILFSGNVAEESVQPNWFAKLMGIRSAKAEGKPSDWFSVPTQGGDITQLTHVRAPYLYGSLSPDGKHIVSYAGDELFSMNPDGSELTVLISGLHSFYGTASWVP